MANNKVAVNDLSCNCDKRNVLCLLKQYGVTKHIRVPLKKLFIIDFGYLTELFANGYN